MSVKHFKMPLCLNGAIKIKSFCLALLFKVFIIESDTVSYILNLELSVVVTFVREMIF